MSLDDEQEPPELCAYCEKPYFRIVRREGMELPDGLVDEASAQIASWPAPHLADCGEWCVVGTYFGGDPYNVAKFCAACELFH